MSCTLVGNSKVPDDLELIKDVNFRNVFCFRYWNLSALFTVVPNVPLLDVRIAVFSTDWTSLAGWLKRV